MRSAIASSAAIVFFASSAFATPEDAKRAQELFDQGRKAMDQHDYVRACPMLEESQRLDPGGGTLINLALCHEKSGKLIVAKQEYEATLARAHADKRKDREKIASTAIAGLVGRIPHVGLVVHDPAPDMIVRIDGDEVARTRWNSVELDPGAHRLEALAPNRLAYATEIQLAEGQASQVEIPPLANPPVSEPTTHLPPPPPPPPLVPPDVHVGAPLVVPPETQRHWLFWPMVGTSAAALGVAGVTGILAFVEKNNANSTCNADRHYCIDGKGVEAIDRARTDAWISTITLGVGVIAAGVAIFLPNQTVKKTGLRIEASPTFAGLSWHAPLP